MAIPSEYKPNTARSSSADLRQLGLTVSQRHELPEPEGVYGLVQPLVELVRGNFVKIDFLHLSVTQVS